MKKKLTFFTGLACLSATLFAQNGTPDASFNSTGKIDAVYETANGICVDNDDKVLVIGHDRQSSTKNVFVNRYKANGTADSSFGTNGRLLFDYNNDYDYGRCIKALPDGKYLISGQTSMGAYFRAWVARVKSNGKLDSSFGSNGICILDPGTESCDAWSFEVGETGSIYVAGYKTLSGTMKSALWKLKPNGTLDQNFGTSGTKVISTNSNAERLFGIDLRIDVVAVAGYSHSGSMQESVVALLDSNGNLLSSFNSTGYKKIVSASKATFIFDVALTSNSVVVSGHHDDNGTDKAILVSYLLNGTPNSNFASSGFYTDNGAKPSQYQELLANCDDELFAGGYYENSGGYNTFRVSKFIPTGTLENGFGSGGHFTIRIRTTDDEAIEAMSFAGESALIFSGRTNLGASVSKSGIAKITIEACNTTGIIPVEQIDFNMYPNPLGKSGVLKIDFSENVSQDIRVSIFSTDGKLVFTGQQPIENQQLSIENLDLASGVYQVILLSGDKPYTAKLIVQ